VAGIIKTTNATANNASDTTTGALVVTGGASFGSGITTGGATYLGLTTAGGGGRRYVEIAADAANQSYIDFHSQDSRTIDYDARILSTGGSASIGTATINIAASQVETGGILKTTNTTASTDTLTGALQVGGGVGVVGRINAGGIIKTTTTTPATDINSGALQVGGGAGIVGRIYAGGVITTTTTVASTDTTTGALVVAGGAGIGGAVNIGGSIKMGQFNTTYRQFSLGGGNSYGYLYGCYAKYGDAIHIGYNFYNDNASNQIYSAGGATSRLTLGYGTIGCYTGGVNTEPTNLGYFQNSSGLVGIGTSSPAAKLDVRRPGSTNAYAEESVLNVKGADYTNADGSRTVYSAGITLHASDLAWAPPNRTYGAKIYIGGGYSVGGELGYNGPIEFSTGAAIRMRINEGGSVTIGGALSKGSGTFDIKHPIKEGYRLVHSFTESPRCDLIYRGKKQLINGQIIINIDKECVEDIDCAMTEGTFEALCANPTVYLQNNETFDKVIGKIVGNKLTILCENKTADCVIDWMVVAERKDELIKEWDKTNDNGYLKTEYKS
jgi:hypothetical protein